MQVYVLLHLVSFGLTSKIYVMANIFLDIDGTIFDHSTYSVPKSALDALAKLNENNTLWLCTGRVYKTAKIDIGIPIDNYICALGATIYRDGKLIHERPFTKQEFDIINAKAKERGLLLGYDCADFTYRPKVLYERMQERIGKEVMNNYWADMDKYNGAPIYKMIVESITGDKEAYEDFMGDLSDRFEFCATAKPEMLASEVTPKGVSKGGAIKELMAKGLFRQEDTICIGDSANDVSMFRVCATSIAMGQGHDCAKKEATYVTDSVSEDGFYKAFKRLGLI